MMNTKRICAVVGAAALLGGAGTIAVQNSAHAQGLIIRHHERHPEMQRALKQLQNAQISLQSAAHDYAGHREKALDLIQRAMAEVQAGIAEDQH